MLVKKSSLVDQVIDEHFLNEKVSHYLFYFNLLNMGILNHIEHSKCIPDLVSHDHVHPSFLPDRFSQLDTQHHRQPCSVVGEYSVIS
jgi:hypothetical protein